MVDIVVIDSHPSGVDVINGINTNVERLAGHFVDGSEPNSPIACQMWLDTSGADDILKQRNSANTAWVTLGTFVANEFIVNGITDKANDNIVIKLDGSVNFSKLQSYITKNVTGATNVSPIVITATGHGRTTGDNVTISGVLGNTAANGTFNITVINVNTFSLDESTGNGTYTSGGIIYLNASNDEQLMRKGQIDANIAKISFHQGILNVKNLIGKQDTDTDHDINFYSPNTNYNSEVLVRDSSYNVSLSTKAGTSEMTKKTDVTWAAGNDVGGLDDNTTLAADLPLYGFKLTKSTDATAHDFIVTDDITGVTPLTDAAVIAAGFDLISVAAPAVPPPLDASNNFIDHSVREIAGGGVYCRLTQRVEDFDGNVTTNASLHTLSAPPYSLVRIKIDHTSLRGHQVLATQVDETDVLPTVDICTTKTQGGAGDTIIDDPEIELFVDGNSQIRLRGSNTIAVKINLLGYTIMRSL